MLVNWREIIFLHILFVFLADLYNLRGSDIEYNPVFYSYAAVTKNEVFLFINESQLTSAAKEALQAGEVRVVIMPYEDLPKFISDQVCLELLDMTYQL